MSSDLGSMTHAEFVNAYGGPQELEDYLEMQALSALTPSSSGGSVAVSTLTDAATVTPVVDDYAGGILTSLSQTTNFANPTGTPTDGQNYWIRIKSSSVRTITFGTAYRWSTSLPAISSTSGSSLTDYIQLRYNSADSKWDVIGINQGF